MQRMKKRNKYKRKQNKRIATVITASVLVAALGTVGVFHHMEPMETYAKESFTGTKQVVEGHTRDDNPFVILDVVPSYATYAWDADTSYEISTGTLGYLSNGQSPMAADYMRIYKDPLKNHSAELSTYEKRAALVNEIWKYGTDNGEALFQYEEAYGSGNTRKDLNTQNATGWQLLIDTTTLPDDDKKKGDTAHSGLMKGYFKKYVEPDPNDPTATTPDKTGYDYIKVGDWSEDEGSGEASQSAYQFDPDKGTYQVQFKALNGSGSTGLTEGYVPEKTKAITQEDVDKGTYKSSTSLYYMDDKSNYVYAGTIADKFSTGSSVSLSEYYNNQDSQNSSKDTASDDTASGNTGSDNTNSDKTGALSTPKATPSAGSGSASTTDAVTTTSPKESESTSPSKDSTVTPSAAPSATPSATPKVVGNSDLSVTATTVSNKVNHAIMIPSVYYSEIKQTTTPTPSAVPVTSSSADPGYSGDGNQDDQQMDEGHKGNDDSTGNGNGNSNSTGNDQSTVNGNPVSTTGTAYYVVTFQYVTDLTENDSRTVYEVIPGSEKEFPLDSGNRPYDVYGKSGASAAASASPSASADAAASASASAGTSPAAVSVALLSATPVKTDKVFLYVGPGAGDYKLTDEADLSEADKKKQAPVWMEIRNAPTYFRFNGGCDWLKQYVFHALSGGDNENENFKIEVRTIRADFLTQDIIKQADLVYLESGTAPFINQESTKVTLQYLTSDTQKVMENGNEVIKGLTRQNAYALVYRAAVELLPVIVDYNAVTNDQYSKLDYQGLAKMFLKEDLENYVKDAQTSPDWLFENLENSNYPNRSDNGNYYVNRNVYVVNSGTPLVNRDFPESIDGGSAESGFSEVLNLIRSENVLLPEENRIPENVSKAKAIEYIINYSVGFIADFTDLRILELQPTSNDKADLQAENPTDSSTTLYWQRNATGTIKKQVLRSSRKVDVKVTTKAAAAFNSEWEDINEKYNLVFIGLDGQKLNYAAGLWSGTVYNNTDLNNKLYHMGDQAANDSGQYDPSDITERKKNELLDFMRAGYPILVENDFFTGKSAKNGADRINTKYVAEDTQMYDFLRQAVTDFTDRIYTIDDVHSNILFMAQLNIDHPVISVSDTTGLTLTEAANGELSVSFTYAITDQNGEGYAGECHTEFYLDINDDGSYTDAERMDNLAGEGKVLRATAENGQATVLFTESPGSRAIPFRLRVVDNSNSCRRSSVQGILQVTDGTKEKIKVLQIGAKDGISLATLYQQENSTLGYYLKAAENTMKVKFEIETIDPAAWNERFARNPDCLNQWDLLIIGFGNGSENLPNMNKIEDYIQAGHSVLVTGKEATEGIRLINQTLLGQLDRKTYGSLGRISGNPYFRYAGLDAGMFNEQSNLGASGLNEGSVFSYPYAIGKSVSLDGGRSYKAYDYLLDLSNLTTPFVTPWFVFTGSGQNAYDISPNDGANNYYLYSRSNVVFIGNDDYSSYTYDVDNPQNPTGTGLQESQMFVNAMMLAYDAGVHNLKVDIVAGFDTDEAKVSSISIPFDQEIKAQNGLLDETVDVYFKFKNSNLTLSNAYAVKFYYEDAAGGTSLDVGDEKVQVTPFTSSLWTVQDNTLTEVSASQIRQGKVYRLKAPVIALQNNTAATNAKIYVEVVSALERPDGSEGAGSKEVRGYDSVTFTRTQLFLLE